MATPAPVSWTCSFRKAHVEIVPDGLSASLSAGRRPQPKLDLGDIGIVARASSPVKAQSNPLAWQVPKRSRALDARATKSCYVAPRICAPREPFEAK